MIVNKTHLSTRYRHVLHCPGTAVGKPGLLRESCGARPPCADTWEEHMHRVIIALVISLVTASLCAQEKSPAELMTIIESPSWGKTADTKKRFEYILPRFVSMCSDIDDDMKAADMLTLSRNKLDEAGLAGEEGLLSVSNTLFGLTSSLSALGVSYSRNMKCAEIFSLYLTARLNGQSPKESKDGVYTLISALATLK